MLRLLKVHRKKFQRTRQESLKRRAVRVRGEEEKISLEMYRMHQITRGAPTRVRKTEDMDDKVI